MASFLETTAIGQGYAGHERDHGHGPRAVDVMADRLARAELVANRLRVEESVAPLAGSVVMEQQDPMVELATQELAK